MSAPDYVTLQYFVPDEILKAREHWRELLNSPTETTRLFDADYYVLEQTVTFGSARGLETLTIQLVKKVIDVAVTPG